MPQETPIEWSAPTHIHLERSTDWYWGLGICAVVGAVLALWFGNLLFAGIIIVAAGCLGVAAARLPREHEVRINQNGVVVDHDFFPYSSIRSFWIDTDIALEPKLFLATTGILHSHLVLILRPPAEPQAVHAYLSQFAEEEEQHSVGTVLAELLGL